MNTRLASSAAEKGLLIVAGLCLAVLLLETGVRLALPHRARFFDDSDFRRNAWELIPHASDDDYVGVSVKINNIGLRGRDVTVPKPEGIYRIVTLGDSITFGYGVPLEKTFPQVLERLLNENLATGTRYEVVNAGVPGTGLSYYEYFVRKRAPQLNPDLILICMALNDITVYRPGPDKPPPSRGRGLNYLLLRHSYLYDLLYVRLRSISYSLGILDLRKEHAGDFLPIEPPSPLQASAWASTVSTLDGILGEVRGEGAQVALVLFPMELQISSKTLDFYTRTFHLKINKMKIASAATWLPRADGCFVDRAVRTAASEPSGLADTPGSPPGPATGMAN